MMTILEKNLAYLYESNTYVKNLTMVCDMIVSFTTKCKKIIYFNYLFKHCLICIFFQIKKLPIKSSIVLPNPN